MKALPTLMTYFLRDRRSRRNTALLLQFLVVLAGMIAVYTVLFHFLMEWEGRRFSWITGLYWTLTVMSTLGFGDITFTSDAGRAFSLIVLLSGIVFLLVLLPFTFIQFFYAPWMEAQAASRAPRELPETMRDHVILTHDEPVAAALIARLNQQAVPYALLVGDLTEALRLHDNGLNVVHGELDRPETYERVRASQAALIATTGSDAVNTNVAFTVREASPHVPIVATADSSASVDILELAGANQVLELSKMLGRSLGRRVIGDAMTHVIGRFGDLLVAEANAMRTPLVGKTLRENRLDQLGVSVAGVWDRGVFAAAGPDEFGGPDVGRVEHPGRNRLQRGGDRAGGRVADQSAGGGRHSRRIRADSDWNDGGGGAVLPAFWRAWVSGRLAAGRAVAVCGTMGMRTGASEQRQKGG